MKSGMVSAWIRLLLIQASWNYRRLIGVGMAFASEPLLRDLPGGEAGERYREALARAAGYFNGNPYLIGLAVGSLARVEHQALAPDQTERLRRALGGPLGSVGDKIVWAGALPFASAVGLIVAVSLSPVVGVVAFLVLYNSVNLVLRLWGLGAGWKAGMQVSKNLGGAAIKLSMRVAGPVAAFAVGLALPVVAAWLTRGLDANALFGVALVASVGIAFARWVWPTLGTLRFGLGVVVVAILVGWL
jgi:PTS system mannose-specific IID component